MPTIASPKRKKVISIAGLRPILSPIDPSTAAPTGRITKPIQNVACDAIRLTHASCEGKNVRPI